LQHFRFAHIDWAGIDMDGFAYSAINTAGKA
jgi:hypothetical protein